MRRKPERIESVAMRPAIIAQAISGEDEEDLFPPETIRGGGIVHRTDTHPARLVS